VDLNHRIGTQLRTLRGARGLTLDMLAARSGVSRSNIALIESGRSSPTAVVLDRLATALEVTVASMFEAPQTAATPLLRVADQPVWTDPASGYMRRNVSPPEGSSPLQLVDVVFPAGARVAFESSGRASEVHQQVWMIQGCMEITSGTATWRLQAGDCLAMRLDRPNVFSNPGDEAARYLVALVACGGRVSGRPS
jgi:transcriptional regulator with XRE-family HTH domain